MSSSRIRYRWRTGLRERLPSVFAVLFPKGKKDCGEHDWYNVDDRIDRCYHCVVGVRPHEPIEVEDA